MVIHSPRLPVPDDSPRISLREVKVMHFSTIDFDRFKSKVRWYQCWEFSKHKWDGRLVSFIAGTIEIFVSQAIRFGLCPMNGPPVMVRPCISWMFPSMITIGGTKIFCVCSRRRGRTDLAKLHFGIRTGS